MHDMCYLQCLLLHLITFQYLVFYSPSKIFSADRNHTPDEIIICHTKSLALQQFHEISKQQSEACKKTEKKTQFGKREGTNRFLTLIFGPIPVRSL